MKTTKFSRQYEIPITIRFTNQEQVAFIKKAAEILETSFNSFVRAAAEATALQMTPKHKAKLYGVGHAYAVSLIKMGKEEEEQKKSRAALGKADSKNARNARNARSIRKQSKVA